MKRSLMIVSTLTAMSFTACQSVNMEAVKPYTDIATQVATQVAISNGVGANSTKLNNALREVLTVGSNTAIQKLSNPSAWGISLNRDAQNIVTALKTAGLGSAVTSAEQKLNTAASKVAEQAKPILQTAINGLTIGNALQIANGGDTAITQYFKGQTESSVKAKLAPLVASQLQQTGFYDQYKTALTAYNALPIPNKTNIDVESLLLTKATDKIYAQMALEEQAMRKDPAARGMAIGQLLIGAVTKK